MPSPALLRHVIEEAIAALADHPRDAKLARALEVTFLRPAPTRELAAERLDLPYSTFRRHLARAVERLAEVFWSMES
jgi:DNA-directed RNA polymerase specialized sigma24 family protein